MTSSKPSTNVLYFDDGKTKNTIETNNNAILKIASSGLTNNKLSINVTLINGDKFDSKDFFKMFSLTVNKVKKPKKVFINGKEINIFITKNIKPKKDNIAVYQNDALIQCLTLVNFTESFKPLNIEIKF